MSKHGRRRAPSRTRTPPLIWAAMLAGAAVQGCMVGPRYEPPDATLSERWLEGADARVASSAAADIAVWWRAFGDPVLDRLVEQAQLRNLTLEAAALRIVQAQALRAIAFGGLFPQRQTLGASYTAGRFSENRGFAGSFGDGGEGEEGGSDFGGRSESFDVSLDVAWELDLWGQLRRAVQAADAQLLAEVAGYDDVLVSLIGEVASTYVRIRVLEERLALARDNVSVQRDSLDLARIRYEAGGTSDLDVQQARTLLSDTEAIIPQLDIELRRSHHALSVLLGAPPHDLAPLLGTARGIPAAPPAVAIGIPADLLRRRPDVRRAERELAAQSARIGVRQADLYPQLQLVGSVGLSAERAGQLFQGDSLEAFGGPVVDWPVLNYGRLINAVRVEDARFQELAASYEQTVLRAQQEVEDALIGYLRGAEQVMHLERSVEAANRAVELSVIQYREGAADYTRVLTTQQAKLQAEDDLASSHGNVTLSVIGLYRALGGGWEVRRAADLLPEDTREKMRERTYWGDELDVDESGRDEVAPAAWPADAGAPAVYPVEPPATRTELAPEAPVMRPR